MSARKASNRIFERIVETEGVDCDAGCAAHLRQRCLTLGAKLLRACYPVDVFRLIKAISKYDGNPATITSANIDRAVDLYFAKSRRRKLTTPGRDRISDSQSS